MFIYLLSMLQELEEERAKNVNLNLDLDKEKTLRTSGTEKLTDTISGLKKVKIFYLLLMQSALAIIFLLNNICFQQELEEERANSVKLNLDLDKEKTSRTTENGKLTDTISGLKKVNPEAIRNVKLPYN